MVELSLLPVQGSLMAPGIIQRLDLKVGYACLNDCLFCVVADKRRFGNKTTDQIKSELEISFSEGKREVVFTGGEVTLRPDVFEIVSYAKELGFTNIQIQTSGRKFSSFDFTKRMVRAGMTEFAPALHGPNAEIHDALTRRPGSWRQTVLGIYNVRKGGIRILVNTVVTKKNYRHLVEIAELLVKLKVTQFQFAFVHIMGNARKYYRSIVPRVSDAAPFIKEGLAVGIRAGVRVMAEAVPYCLMEGFEEYIAESYTPPTQLREVGWRIDDFEQVRKNDAKKRFASCSSCLCHAYCEGPWKEYPELFGEEEFKPRIHT